MFYKTSFAASILGVFVASVPGALALFLDKRAVAGPVINRDFPDPGLMRNGADGVWYAYSTSSGGKNIPVAKSTDFNTWSIVGTLNLSFHHCCARYVDVDMGRCR